MMDYEISGYSLHPVNLSTDIGKWIAVYSHESLDKSTIQIDPDISFEEICLLEVRLLAVIHYFLAVVTEVRHQPNIRPEQRETKSASQAYIKKGVQPHVYCRRLQLLKYKLVIVDNST